jgi:hypothetical protein
MTGYSNGDTMPSRRSFVLNRPSVNTWHTAASGETQPTASQIVHLWQTYLTNVDPIMKVFHAPTVQLLVHRQVGKPSALPNEQALLSAIYLISVVSLWDDECEALLQEPREDLIRRFRQATEDALSGAGFVTTNDIMVLQAFVLYLNALRSLGETDTVWSLSGLAIRIAGTMGLARDGSKLGLPPFEAEMRRRLWWAMVYLDSRTSELVGQEGDLLVQKFDVQKPANLNDVDLFPGMQRLRSAKAASSEMFYVQYRTTVCSVLRKIPGDDGPPSTGQKMTAKNVPLAEKAQLISDLERQFQDEILQLCDGTVPLQLFAMNSVRTLTGKLRLIAKVPIVPEPEESATMGGSKEDEYSENSFLLSLDVMQTQLELWSEPSLQKWKWHWRVQFQWYAMVQLLRQTRLRAPGPMTTKAWTTIRAVFDKIIPNLELGPKKSILLDSIRSMFGAATNGQENADANQAKASGSGDANARGECSNPTSEPSARERLTHLTPFLGSNPHNACLPGMDESASRPNGQGTHEQEQGGDITLPYSMPELLGDPILDFDLDSMDWPAFDRLSAELFAQ